MELLVEHHRSTARLPWWDALYRPAARELCATMVLCQLSTLVCISESTVAGTLTGPHRVRPGVKSLDAKYAELWAPAPGGLNVSIQWSAVSTNDQDDLSC